jgi:hypothetical protein
VVEDINLQKLAGADEVAGDLDVGFTGRGITAGMIMLCGTPIYVQ